MKFVAYREKWALPRIAPLSAHGQLGPTLRHQESSLPQKGQLEPPVSARCVKRDVKKTPKICLLELYPAPMIPPARPRQPQAWFGLVEIKFQLDLYFWRSREVHLKVLRPIAGEEQTNVGKAHECNLRNNYHDPGGNKDFQK